MAKDEYLYYRQAVGRPWTCPRASCHAQLPVTAIQCACAMFHPDVPKLMKHNPFVRKVEPAE
eukprot:3481230-Lingulodinium_polyedra.AAC.1